MVLSPGVVPGYRTVIPHRWQGYAAQSYKDLYSKQSFTCCMGAASPPGMSLGSEEEDTRRREEIMRRHPTDTPSMVDAQLYLWEKAQREKAKSFNAQLAQLNAHHVQERQSTSLQLAEPPRVARSDGAVTAPTSVAVRQWLKEHHPKESQRWDRVLQTALTLEQMDHAAAVGDVYEKQLAAEQKREQVIAARCRSHKIEERGRAAARAAQSSSHSHDVNTRAEQLKCHFQLDLAAQVGQTEARAQSARVAREAAQASFLASHSEAALANQASHEANRRALDESVELKETAAREHSRAVYDSVCHRIAAGKRERRRKAAAQEAVVAQHLQELAAADADWRLSVRNREVQRENSLRTARAALEGVRSEVSNEKKRREDDIFMRIQGDLSARVCKNDKKLCALKQKLEEHSDRKMQQQVRGASASVSPSSHPDDGLRSRGLDNHIPALEQPRSLVPPPNNDKIAPQSSSLSKRPPSPCTQQIALGMVYDDSLRQQEEKDRQQQQRQQRRATFVRHKRNHTKEMREQHSLEVRKRALLQDEAEQLCREETLKEHEDDLLMRTPHPPKSRNETSTPRKEGRQQGSPTEHSSARTRTGSDRPKPPQQLRPFLQHEASRQQEVDRRLECMEAKAAAERTATQETLQRKAMHAQLAHKKEVARVSASATGHFALFVNAVNEHVAARDSCAEERLSTATCSRQTELSSARARRDAHLASLAASAGERVTAHHSQRRERYIDQDRQLQQQRHKLEEEDQKRESRYQLAAE